MNPLIVKYKNLDTLDYLSYLIILESTLNNFKKSYDVSTIVGNLLKDEKIVDMMFTKNILLYIEPEYRQKNKPHFQILFRKDIDIIDTYLENIESDPDASIILTETAQMFANDLIIFSKLSDTDKAEFHHQIEEYNKCKLASSIAESPDYFDLKLKIDKFESIIISWHTAFDNSISLILPYIEEEFDKQKIAMVTGIVIPNDIKYAADFMLKFDKEIVNHLQFLYGDINNKYYSYLEKKLSYYKNAALTQTHILPDNISLVVQKTTDTDIHSKKPNQNFSNNNLFENFESIIHADLQPHKITLDNYKVKLEYVFNASSVDDSVSFAILNEGKFEDLKIITSIPPNEIAELYLHYIKLEYCRILIKIDNILKTSTSIDEISLFATKNIQHGKNLLSDLSNYANQLDYPNDNYPNDQNYYIVFVLKMYLVSIILKLQDFFKAFITIPIETYGSLIKNFYQEELNFDPFIRLSCALLDYPYFRVKLNTFDSLKSDFEKKNPKKKFESFGSFLFTEIKLESNVKATIDDKILYFINARTFWQQLLIQDKLKTMIDIDGVKYNEPEIEMILIPLIESEISRLEKYRGLDIPVKPYIDKYLEIAQNELKKLYAQAESEQLSKIKKEIFTVEALVLPVSENELLTSNETNKSTAVLYPAWNYEYYLSFNSFLSNCKYSNYLDSLFSDFKKYISNKIFQSGTLVNKKILLNSLISDLNYKFDPLSGNISNTKSNLPIIPSDTKNPIIDNSLIVSFETFNFKRTLLIDRIGLLITVYHNLLESIPFFQSIPDISEFKSIFSSYNDFKTQLFDTVINYHFGGDEISVDFNGYSDKSEYFKYLIKLTDNFKQEFHNLSNSGKYDIGQLFWFLKHFYFDLDFILKGFKLGKNGLFDLQFRFCLTTQTQFCLTTLFRFCLTTPTQSCLTTKNHHQKVFLNFTF